MKLVSRGAEADIYKTRWNGAEAILKIREPKGYRDPSLDARIRARRTSKEAQMISHARSSGVPAPLVYFVDRGSASIVMQYVGGRTVHDMDGSEIVSLSDRMGRYAGTLHKSGVMHGDLTTSNFILSSGMLFMIDFGLAQNTPRAEDHAVDLRLIKEILNSAHAAVMRPAWDRFLKGYSLAVGSRRAGAVTRLVAEIEKRGRYARVV